MATSTPAPIDDGRYHSPWTRTVDLRTALRAAWAWLRAPRLLSRIYPALSHHLSHAPASTAYAFTLFVTWWTLRGLGPVEERKLIFSASTNLHNMRDNPIQVLVASAFWTEGNFPWVTIAEFLVLMALAERWLGTGRWILLFATGHIGATLLTVYGISRAIEHQMIPLRTAIVPDVGTSYGFVAVLTAMAFRFRGWVRLAWVATVLLVLLAAVISDRTFTAYGHLCAGLIGLFAAALATAFWTAVERRRVAQRLGEVPLSRG
ncbi:rhomboid-like protein [Nocardia sp. NPDC050712]|uniref:rhomboid-like protein n=1 Tax=Nocardia sp. NPDC050712 TaxID=3155518 RepID=UPI0033D7750E